MFRAARARAAAAGLLAGGLLLLPAGAAAAHDELVSSSPADESTLATAPAAVTLTFAGPPRPEFVTVRVTGPDGATDASGNPTLSSATVRAPLTTSAAGRYRVAWRVVADDGHPVSGVLSFSVEAAPSAGSPTSTVAAQSADTSQVAATVAAASDAGESSRAVPTVLLAVGTLAAFVLLFVLTAWRGIVKRRGAGS